MRDFRQRLQTTADGQRYLYAWQNMLSTIKKIRVAQNPWDKATWQVEYIKASEEAGRLLEILEREHSWPARLPTPG
jgi:hypothetical protein